MCQADLELTKTYPPLCLPVPLKELKSQASTSGSRLFSESGSFVYLILVFPTLSPQFWDSKCAPHACLCRISLAESRSGSTETVVLRGLGKNHFFQESREAKA